MSDQGILKVHRVSLRGEEFLPTKNPVEIPPPPPPLEPTEQPPRIAPWENLAVSVEAEPQKEAAPAGPTQQLPPGPKFNLIQPGQQKP